jgi:hypothetical protein
MFTRFSGKSRDSSAGRVTGYEFDGQGSIPSIGKRPADSGAHPASIQWVRVLFPRI